MSETRATVTARDGEYAYVRTEDGGCGRCHESGGCGGANISQMLCGSERQWRVLNPRGAAVGEKVTVTVGDGAIRAGATLLYGVPLSGFIGGAMLGAASPYGEAGGIVGGLIGLLAAWLWTLRRIRRRHCDPRYQPHIV